MEKWKPSDGDLKCQMCHNANPLWFCDNNLFNEVNGSPNGILCPVCFILKAEKLGLTIVFEAKII